MQSIRQLGAGVIIAIISVILVLGGIILSVAENLPAAATPTLIPPTLPLSFPTPPFTAIVAPPTETTTQAVIASPSPFPSLTLAPSFAAPTVCTSAPPAGWVRILARTGDTLY